MKNTQLKDNGLSRGFKLPAGYITQYQSWPAFLADACSAAGISCDITGLRAAGVNVFGTGYSKAEVLPDSLCTALGLAATATPAQALDKLRTMAAGAQSTADGRLRYATGSYTGTGNTGQNHPTTVTLPFRPQIFICHVGSGPVSFGGQYGGWSSNYGFMVVGRSGGFPVIYNTVTTNLVLTVTDNSISWYVLDSDGVRDKPHYQFNWNGSPYYYLAIG